MNAKIQATLGSRNFFVSLISVFLLAFELNNLSLGAGAEQIIDTVTSGDVGRIAALFLVNFLNPILKLVQKTAEWSWAFLKSPNFWTQVITVILVALTGLGITFPDGAASGLVDAIFTGEFQVIAIAAVVNVLNPLYHFFFDRPEAPEISGVLSGKISIPPDTYEKTPSIYDERLPFLFKNEQVERNLLFFTIEGIRYFNTFLYRDFHETLLHYILIRREIGISEVDTINQFIDQLEIRDMITFDALKKGSYRLRKDKNFPIFRSTNCI